MEAVGRSANPTPWKRDDRAQPWETCGGLNFQGPTICVEDYVCAFIDTWYSQCISGAKEEFHKSCTSSGRANADIAGIGVLVALGIQAAISIVLTFSSGWLSDECHLRIHLLLATVDTQIITGISLLVSALATWTTTDLYHFHIVYDITSIAGATIWPALYRASVELHRMKKKPPFKHRIFVSSVFLLFYVVLAILFGIRLHGWDPNIPGQCFEGHTFLRPNPEKRTSYRSHLAITTLLIALPFLISLILSYASIGSEIFRKDRWIFVLFYMGISQVILHAVFFGTLRNRDQHFLVESESESQWTFGQIIVMFSLVAMLFEFYREIMSK